MNYNLQCQQFSLQFIENIENAEDTKTYDAINADIKTQNNELTEMFTKQEKCVKDMEPCLESLERIHKENSNLLEPIENLTDEVIYLFLFCFIITILSLFFNSLFFFYRTD